MRVKTKTVIHWIPVTEQPQYTGHFLCAIETDAGQETDILEWDGRNWICEGEPTFCKSYQYRPYAWALCPCAPARNKFPE